MHRNRNSELTTDLTDVVWARLEKHTYSGILQQIMMVLNVMSMRRIVRNLEGDVSATFIPPWVRHRVRRS